MHIKLTELKNSLFWRMSLVFLFLVLLIGFAYVFITAYTAQRYYSETTQRLNAEVAEHLLLEVDPFQKGGEINKEALHKIMHSMMAVNPSLEVYLLDPEGEILSFVVLDKKVKLKSVSLAPIKEFLASDGRSFVLGDDPRQPRKNTVFSACPVRKDGELLGYVYLVLASEQYENIADTVWNSYLLSLGTRFFTLSLGAAFILGLVMIWLLTRNLRKIIQSVRKFGQGDLEARIPVKSKGELANLALIFNKMADTIVQNIQDLEQVDELRRELIANISHDLRTPLSVIQGYVETLIMKQGSLNQEEESKYLNIILKSSEHLTKLVGDLFELTKLEAGQITLQKQSFTLAALVEEVQAKYSLMAAEKKVKLIPQITHPEVLVYADIEMMKRVIQNLVDNAIQHSPEGSEITLRLERNHEEVELSVRNTGVGISKEEIPKIFDRYYKVEKHYGENKGTGLGLAIVKNILDLHQSLIEVKSKLNEYTTFYFKLPVYQ